MNSDLQNGNIERIIYTTSSRLDLNKAGEQIFDNSRYPPSNISSFADLS